MVVYLKFSILYVLRSRSFEISHSLSLMKQYMIDIESVSTGSLGLDIALGIGGLPRGRIIEIYGPESSGKTTLALHVIAEAQKTGGTCAFLDAEHDFKSVFLEYKFLKDRQI